MNIRQHVSLKDHSTMRLGGKAAYLANVHSIQDLVDAISWADQHQLPMIMIGHGSNIIWADKGYLGLVIVNKLTGLHIRQDGDLYFVKVAAGEVWDKVVGRTVEGGLTGIEGLSLIPGTAGATPIQNVGAYGQEISQTLVSLEAYDRGVRRFVTLHGDDCGFGYRTSRFKTVDRGRFFITSITLVLKVGNPKPPHYGALQKYYDDHGIQYPTPQVMRKAVIAIRSSKLPDPAKIANTGSFFANPVVDRHKLNQLTVKYGDVPHWLAPDDMIKLSAAWLIETAGLKGVSDSETGMATWEHQPLVLVNKKARRTSDLITFKQIILDAVYRQFGIILEQEPELLP